MFKNYNGGIPVRTHVLHVFFQILYSLFQCLVVKMAGGKKKTPKENIVDSTDASGSEEEEGFVVEKVVDKRESKGKVGFINVFKLYSFCPK